MWRRFRPPLLVVAVALLGLIALLAVLQYRWLGQISEAERAQRRATLAAGASEFARDFDREITRAYLLFLTDPAPNALSTDDPQLAERVAARYDHWQASARFPRLLKEFYAFSQDESGSPRLRRFDPVARRFDAVDWPESMANWHEHLTAGSWKETAPSGSAFFIRRMPSAIWEEVPAIVVPVPMVFLAEPPPDLRMTASIGYTLLTIDREYMTRELLPSLAERHFGRAGAGLDFKVAVVSRESTNGMVFQSTPSFTPAIDTPADATADLFQVRTQDFTTLASEVRRFRAFGAFHGAENAVGRFTLTETRPPLSILIKPDATSPPGATTGGVRSVTTSARVTTAASTPHWKLVVSHPSGSLDTAVDAQRTRNLAISSSILAVLGASMGLLILSTRRAQRLAKQQMEFVAAVSHELRTPLAVLRSAAENLADGVVHDDDRIRRYGELMRTEGRRLTEMVEQILEFAGIQSGQRGFALRPVAIEPLLRDIVSSSSGLIENAGLTVEFDLPADLPPVLGDEPALRRAFQNLIDNAIKYGASGGWIRLSAHAVGSDVTVSVADRGIGIAPAEQARIFEPFYRAADVVAAQVQGAGLGLSLVQRIVLAHAGRITVKSAPRAGSEFSVLLPAAPEDPAGQPARANEPAVDVSPGVEAPRYS